jgi:valyl-tRNA synthetase
MDEGPSRAVRTTFVNLYKKGLIYRGERIINWCPRCSTALSDLEVEHEQVSSHLYHVRYRLEGESGEYITVATTRPETILGDTAVAVNPQDERFKDLLARKAILPILGRFVPIIADKAVDPTFGTGAVKITPAHDPVDFEVAQRHDLPSVNILNPDATMNENAGPYVGLDRFACRKAILKDLEKEGLLVKIEPYVHSVGHCQRCKTTVEPWISKQWFVSIKPLAQPALEAVAEGRIKIIPERFTKVYLNWMENIRDWCISRQLWWGHRIPVWYCHDCGEITVSVADPSACSRCGSKSIYQDPDVLDTWFSSAIWPHSTLGWPDATKDLSYFYPTTVLETAYDILFFWVARMVMMGVENTGQIPFQFVYLHGLVRDEKGEKMSKSRGNVVNPLEAIERYGGDALRFALSIGNTPGNDLKLSDQRLEAGRNFANKLWNAARFVLAVAAGPPRGVASTPQDLLPLPDRWILSRLNRVIGNMNNLMEDFQLSEALRQAHDFLWGEFCDWYIEIAKIRLRQPVSEQPSPIPILVHVLEAGLRLLHPFIPFITEIIWQNLKRRLRSDEDGVASIMIAPYPNADESFLDADAERDMATIIDIVRDIRNARAELKLEPSKWIEAVVVAGEFKSLVEDQAPIIKTMARVDPLLIEANLIEKPKRALALISGTTEVYLPLAGILDLEAERARLQEEIEYSQAKVIRLESRLTNRDFITKAPSAVVERERSELEVQRDKLRKLRERLTVLS